MGALEAEQIFAVAVIVVSTLLNAAYFLPIVYAAFFRAPKENGNPGGHEAEHGEASRPIVFALVFAAAGTVLLFFFPGPALELARALVGGPG